MEKEWWPCMRNCNNTDEGGGSDGSGGSDSGLGNDDGAKKINKSPKQGPDGNLIRCSNYGKKGHLGKDCWSKPKKGKTHVAQTKEEGNSLFLVSGAIDTPIHRQPPGRRHPHSLSGR
jgi:hypothetical protein